MLIDDIYDPTRQPFVIQWSGSEVMFYERMKI